MNNVRSLTQLQKLVQGIRIVLHLYIIVLLVDVEFELFSKVILMRKAMSQGVPNAQLFTR